MVNLSFVYVFPIIAGSLCIFPSYYTLYYYLKTRIFDYLIFAGFFICSIISSYGVIIRVYYLSVYRISNVYASVEIFVLDVLLTLMFMFLYLYFLRMKWKKPPKFIIIISGIWGTFWLAIHLLRFTSYIFTWHPILLLVSDLIMNLSTIVVLGVTISIYIKIEPVIEHQEIKKIKTLWILAFICISIFSILNLGSLLYFFKVPVFNPISFGSFVIGFLLIAYTSLKYPESIIISYSQVIRAYNLYKEFNSFKMDNARQSSGIDSIITYIREMPPELFNKMDSDPKSSINRVD